MADATDISVPEQLPDRLWRRILADPERAPELIAVAAAGRFAGPAAGWVQAAGHGTKPAALANRAYRKHVHVSRAEGLALGVGGALTAAGNVAGLGWIQARMVFFIAAAYGYEPHDPMRPAELLALWGCTRRRRRRASRWTGQGTRWPRPWSAPSSRRPASARSPTACSATSENAPPAATAGA